MDSSWRERVLGNEHARASKERRATSLQSSVASCLLVEELRARRRANRCNGWMRDSPLDRNRIEAFHDTLYYADRSRTILAAYL